MRLSAYMITGDGDETTLVRQVERALELGVDRVQLRRKTASARELEALATRLARISPGAARRILVNDRLDVALSAGLGGVHLPSRGLPLGAVVRSAPRGLVIACSTHDREEAERASELGASFIVFGPVFPTESKPGHPGVGLDALAEVVSAVPIPVFALGGVTAERVAVIAEAGAAGVAGISAFENDVVLGDLMRSLERTEGSSR